MRRESMGTMIKIVILMVCVMGMCAGLVSQTLWTNYSNNPVINDAFDSGSVITHRPSVVYDGSQYRMWYSNVRTYRCLWITHALCG